MHDADSVELAAELSASEQHGALGRHLSAELHNQLASEMRRACGNAAREALNSRMSARQKVEQTSDAGRDETAKGSSSHGDDHGRGLGEIELRQHARRHRVDVKRAATLHCDKGKVSAIASRNTVHHRQEQLSSVQLALAACRRQ